MKLANVIIGVGGLAGVWLNVTQPLGATRYRGQPALVSDQAASRLAPSGFDQAQGRGR